MLEGFEGSWPFEKPRRYFGAARLKNIGFYFNNYIILL